MVFILVPSTCPWSFKDSHLFDDSRLPSSAHSSPTPTPQTIFTTEEKSRPKDRLEPDEYRFLNLTTEDCLNPHTVKLFALNGTILLRHLPDESSVSDWSQVTTSASPLFPFGLDSEPGFFGCTFLITVPEWLFLRLRLECLGIRCMVFSEAGEPSYSNDMYGTPAHETSLVLPTHEIRIRPHVKYRSFIFPSYLKVSFSTFPRYDPRLELHFSSPTHGE